MEERLNLFFFRQSEKGRKKKPPTKNHQHGEKAEVSNSKSYRWFSNSPGETIWLETEGGAGGADI